MEDTESNKSLQIVFLFDINQRLFIIDTSSTSSLCYKSWLIVNYLLQSLITITQSHKIHVHITIALTSQSSYHLILHDCCLASPEHMICHPCNDTISTYSLWVRILSLNSDFNQSQPRITNTLQNYIYLSNLMTPRSNSKPILILVTPNTGMLDGIEFYENVGTQLASLGTKCMIINLEDKANFRASQLLSRVRGVYVQFSEIAIEMSQQSNPVNYTRGEGQTFLYRMNSDMLQEKQMQMISGKKDFTSRFNSFLLEESVMSIQVFPKTKTNMIIMELDTYILKSELDIIRRTRESESFKVKVRAEKLRASILWKPNIKIIYEAIFSKDTTQISITLKTTSSISSALLNESSTSSRLLAPQLEAFISSIHSTDYITQRIQELFSDFNNQEILKEISSVPLCTYHKWFNLKTIDVMCATKSMTHKSRSSYLSDYSFFKRNLQVVFKESGLQKVKGSVIPAYSLSFGNSFTLVKPIFFASNAAVIFLCFYHNSVEKDVEKIVNNVCEKLIEAKKLRVLTRPLHLFAFWDPIQELLAHHKGIEYGRVSMTDTLLKDIEEENQELVLEEAERELEAQYEEGNIGASIFTYVPFKETVRCYMNRKQWSWSNSYSCVLKGFISLLSKQRYSEGFISLNAHKSDILFVKEENVCDCSLDGDGKILLFYIIRYNLINEQKIETEFYIEKKDTEKVNKENRLTFEEMSNEIYRIDVAILKVIWSYHTIKRDCLKQCASRKVNSLKHCGFFFDTIETTASKSFLIKLFSVFMECYKIYSEKKYKENPIIEIQENRVIDMQLSMMLNDKFNIDPELLCQNSTQLDMQKFVIFELNTIRSKIMEPLTKKEYDNILSNVKESIAIVLEEFADISLETSMNDEAKRVYAKIISKKQIILIIMSTPIDSNTILIEYKKFSKDCFSFFDSNFMSEEERRKQIMKKEKHQEDIKDELILLMIEDVELDSEIFYESEIHDVHFELSLLKVVQNFKLYLAEEYNGLLFSFAYNLIHKGYQLSLEALEQILNNAHKFTFTFNLTPIFAITPVAPEVGITIDTKVSELLSTFFKELTTGYYYYAPKNECDHNQIDKTLYNELEGLFSELGKTDKLPLFVKFNVVFKQKDGTKETKLVKRFSEIFVESNKAVKTTLHLVAYFMGKHKEHKGERYYEKRDMDDCIHTEDYYEQFSEGIILLENLLVNLITDHNTSLPHVTINIDKYLYQATGMLYPFQARSFAQLIPENYSKGSFIFSINDEYTRALYAILRPIKAFLSELLLHTASKIPLVKINSDIMNYIRLKMGELYPSAIERQVHEIFFVDYSQLALEILAEELDSIKYNIRHIDSYYYVVWNSSREILELENTESKGVDCNSDYKVRYWILLSLLVDKDVVQMQVIVNFGFTVCSPQDRIDFVKASFENAFSKISSKVNKKILLIHLNITKECPDKLFPLNNKQSLPITGKKEGRNTIKNPRHWFSVTPNKDLIITKASAEISENNSMDPIKESVLNDSYTLDPLHSKEIQVNDKVSIKDLADPRCRFPGLSTIQNRPYMYVVNNDKSIYILKFSEHRCELTLKPGNYITTLRIDLYGIEKAEKEFIDQLMTNIENKLMMIALTKIAHNITFNSGLLSIYDYKFLYQSEDKIDLLFPIQQLNDSYAFMKYLSQNLKKFMATYKLEMLNKKYFEQRDTQCVMRNNTPIIINAPDCGRLEKFVIEKDDPDFSLVFNFMNEVNNMVLWQVFGNGLCLLKMSTMTSPSNKTSIEEFASNPTMQVLNTEQYMNRYVSLSKYNRNTLWTEYISVFDDNLQLITKFIDDASITFVYPIIVKHTGDKLNVDSDTYNKCNNDNWQKCLKLSLSMKGRLNSEEFIDSMILYTNQSITEYLMESSFELIETTILLILNSYDLSSQEKENALLACLDRFTGIITKLGTFATEVKSCLFYTKETPISIQYWNSVWLVAKIVNEVCTKCILPQVSQNQLDSLCLFLLIFVVNNSDDTVKKIYVLKNVHHHETLYTFLRKTFTFQNIEMRNYSVKYQLLLFSKTIPELSSIFLTQSPPPDLPIVFLDCSSQGINVGDKGLNLHETTTLEFPCSEDTMEENLVSIKARQSIPVKRNAYCIIPRTVFLQIIMTQKSIYVNAYNFNKKSVEGIEGIVTNLTALSIKRSEALNIILLKKLGVLSTEGMIQDEKETFERVSSSHSINALNVMRDLVSSALRNKNLIELNKFSSQEKSFVRKNAYNYYNNVEANENYFKGTNVISLPLSTLALNVLSQDKILSTDLDEAKFEIGYCPPDSIMLAEKGSRLFKEVLHSKKGLKYFCTNPFYYHMVNMQIKIDEYKKYKTKLVDRLQFYTQYVYRTLNEVFPEQREYEEKLFKYLNLTSALKKEEEELIGSLKSISSFTYSYIVPFMFINDSDNINIDAEKSKTAYLTIFSDYFRGLCEMIKFQCNVIELFQINVKSSSIVEDSVDLEKVIDNRRYLTKFETQIFIDNLPSTEPDIKSRELAFGSSLFSHKDSVAESEERGQERYQLSAQPAHRSLAYRLNSTRSYQVEQCKGYFLSMSQGAAYIIELEWIQNFVQVKLWTLPEIMNVEHLSASDRCFLGDQKNIQECHSVHTEHTANNILSTLRMDIINYDLHVQSFLHILNGFREQRRFLDVINAFVQYYPEPPKKAKNKLAISLISVCMGDYESNPEEFWRYFVSNNSRYSYKSLQYDQVIFCEIPSSDTLIDSTESRKLSKDEEKKDLTPSMYRKLQESSTYKEGTPEIFDKILNPKKNKRKKCNNSLPFEQLKHEDSTNEKEENSAFIRSGANSRSSHKDSPSYQSYAVFGLCKNSMELKPIFKREQTLKTDELIDDPNCKETSNSLEVEMCGIQAVSLRAEDYSQFNDTIPPKILYTDIEDVLRDKIRECRRHYLNDKLWDKLSRTSLDNTKDFNYMDLKRLYHYSEKENVTSNKNYSELLLSYKGNYNNFFNKLMIKYKKSIIAFSKRAPKALFTVKEEERNSVLDYCLLDQRISRHHLAAGTGESIESVDDYLIKHENKHIPIAIHITRENDSLSIYLLRKYGWSLPQRELATNFANEVCNLYVFCSFLTMIKQV